MSIAINACDPQSGPPADQTILNLDKFGQTMKAGVPCSDGMAHLFYGFLLLALLFVVLICRKKFERFSDEDVDGEKADYVSKLRPRYLATRQEYSNGLFVYIGSMASMVALLSIYGPTDPETFKKIFFNTEFSKDFTFAAQPLLMALLFLGVLPNFPVLQEIEKWFRRVAHKCAFIPAAARKTTDKLMTSGFDFGQYAQAATSSAQLRAVLRSDFAQQPDSLEHTWARLCCLAYELERRRMSGQFGSLDPALLSRYAEELDGIEDGQKALEGEVAAYRQEKSSKPDYSNYALQRRIRSSLERLYILLGCAARLATSDDRAAQAALESFGFTFASTPASADSAREASAPHAFAASVGVIVIPLNVLVVGFAAVLAGKLRLWTVSPLFPQVWFQPLVDATSATIAYGSAILAAHQFRIHAMRRGWWFDDDGLQGRVMRYATVALVAAAASYMASLVWGSAFAPLTLSWVEAALPATVMPALTGLFYVYHLDREEHDAPPPGWRDVALQAALTGICGFIATGVSLKILFADVGLTLTDMLDQIAYTAVVATAIGASLGWYFPHAAAAMRHHQPERAGKAVIGRFQPA